MAEYVEAIATFSDKTHTPFDTLRRVFQELAKEEFLFFVDRKGTYTLNLNKSPLPYELDDVPQELYLPPKKKLTEPEKHRREYTVELFVRSRTWAVQARKIYGDMCLLENCQNTFLKENGERYIETHHIVPLYMGGEDSLSNLCVVCAHHHRAAHFAISQEIEQISKRLTSVTREILKGKDIDCDQ